MGGEAALAGDWHVRAHDDDQRKWIVEEDLYLKGIRRFLLDFLVLKTDELANSP